MPAGKTHDKINLLFLPTFLVGMTFIGFVSLNYALLFSFGFIFGTFFFGPDLDTKSQLVKRWGILQFIWQPYRKMFPHRSILTHGMVIGDVVRILYLIIWMIPVIGLPSYLLTLLSESFDLTMPLYLIGFSVLLLIFCFYPKMFSDSTFTKVILRYHTNFAGMVMTACILFAISINLVSDFSIFHKMWMVNRQNPYDLYFFLLGIVVASSVHTISDIFYSSMKRIFN